jgi:hypothetical protein
MMGQSEAKLKQLVDARAKINHERRDYTGEIFNCITVLGPAPDLPDTVERRNSQWHVRCICGVTKIMGSDKFPQVKSCGCKQKLPKGIAARNRIFRDYRNNAKRRSLVWELTIEQFHELVTDDCYYCGAPPYAVCDEPDLNGIFVWNGINRVDNTLGYPLSNVVTCCAICNHAKCAMPERDFLSWIERVAEYQRQKRTFKGNIEWRVAVA